MVNEPSSSRCSLKGVIFELRGREGKYIKKNGGISISGERIKSGGTILKFTLNWRGVRKLEANEFPPAEYNLTQINMRPESPSARQASVL